MRALALWAIRVYQRLISPNKGFSCAYRVYTGHVGCSELGYRAIRRFGVLEGIGVLNIRLDKCSQAHAHMRAARPTMLRGQAGFLDCDCSCDGDRGCLDFLDPSCCDWGGSDKRSARRNKKYKTIQRPFKLPPRPKP